ncbi:protein-disulfide reductase DsbD family protein [Hyphomonas sp.]|uniref:protein-disulfide reductase DsbD family protein n=1 Tax=Hyphomonas sp. TaxID=87 RepID=UPI00391BD18E
MTRIYRAVLAAFAGLLLLAPAASAQWEASGRRAKAELVSERTRVAPGETIYIALKMTMEPGWHIYWKNAGDAGLPPQLILKEGTTLPEGALGEMMWPLPKLLPVVEGEIMDYGYDDEAVFALPLTIPGTASGEVRIEAVADYLICESVCVPETADVSLVLPVGAPEVDVAGGDLIGAWIAKVPGPFPGEARIDAAAAPWTLSLALEGGFPDGARIRFFPSGHEIRHPAMQPQRGGPNGASLTLTPDPSGAVEETLDGIIRVDRPGAEPAGYEIRAVRGEVFPGTADAAAVPESGEADGAALSLGGLLGLAGLAFLGGLILNLMPCVLPVLSMKAVGMVSAASSGHAGELRSHGLWYTGGVMVSFTALAVAILAVREATGFATLGFQMQHAPTVVVLALIMFAVGLWLMGVFELGASIQNTGSGLANRSGAAGAFFTGVLAAVVGAPCVGPFLGFALGAVMVQPAPAVMAVFLAMGFGMALPFLALSFVPGLHRILPKPGKWMETLKQAFAFPMFLTAAWLLSVVAGLAGAGAVGWTLGGATALVFAIWLARDGGLFRRTFALGALALGFVAPALLANVPDDFVAGAPELPAYAQGAWSTAEVDAALAQDRPVFVDFTASWCASCQVNKLTTLSSRRVKAAFEDAGVVFLVADFTQKDPLIAEELKQRGRAGVPMYLWYAAGSREPAVLPELLSQDLVIGYVEGRQAATSPP